MSGLLVGRGVHLVVMVFFFSLFPFTTNTRIFGASRDCSALRGWARRDLFSFLFFFFFNSQERGKERIW